jgi:hypothetical protein
MAEMDAFRRQVRAMIPQLGEVGKSSPLLCGEARLVCILVYSTVVGNDTWPGDTERNLRNSFGNNLLSYGRWRDLSTRSDIIKNPDKFRSGAVWCHPDKSSILCSDRMGTTTRSLSGAISTPTAAG